MPILCVCVYICIYIWEYIHVYIYHGVDVYIFLCIRVYMCGHIYIYRHWIIHVCEHYMFVFLWSFMLTKEFVSWALSTADIQPCFRKHVFHLYGLLAPGCFLPPVKKCWTDSNVPSSHQITCPYWEKPHPPHLYRARTWDMRRVGPIPPPNNKMPPVARTKSQPLCSWELCVPMLQSLKGRGFKLFYIKMTLLPLRKCGKSLSGEGFVSLNVPALLSPCTVCHALVPHLSLARGISLYQPTSSASWETKGRISVPVHSAIPSLPRCAEAAGHLASLCHALGRLSLKCLHSSIHTSASPGPSPTSSTTRAQPRGTPMPSAGH